MNAAPHAVSLSWLLDGIASLREHDAAAQGVRVEDVTLDSREVRAGSLFLAVAGAGAHGLDFVADAVARGAGAVLWDAEDGAGPRGAPPPPAAAALVAPVRGLKRLLGRIADRFFGWPSSHLRVVGVTGTNGKTTCAYLLAQILSKLKSDAAYMGTVGWGRVGALAPSAHTTPDVVTVHRRLAALRAQGVRDVAMEVSSHALDQGRVDGVRFHSTAFTNLTRDHLDYHGTMQAYGDAKARLFASPEMAHRVINIGDDFGRDLALRGGARVPLTAVWVGAGVGWLGDRTLYAEAVTLDLVGVSLTVAGSYGTARVTTKLLGRFNAENVVIVLACLAGLGVPLRDAAVALADCTPPPGRLEVIDSGAAGKPLVVVDYAHTPDALAKALNALRDHCQGALWCVFGCGGDRDPGKRPLMGAIADELADQIIVTDDNPRSEIPERITRGITAGIKTHTARVIHDRSLAIATAVNEARAPDMVLIAGKGHEDYQIYGDSRRRFSDRDEALRHLGAAA